MQPSAAEIKTQACNLARPSPTADASGRLKHHCGEPARRQTPRRRYARGSGAHYDHVGVGVHGAQSRLSKEVI
jgi:hypothetical protein